jgi:predicted molibdopterin-dependent oxidoreductase YjgC
VIFQDVARALGLSGWHYVRAEDVFQEMARRLPVFEGLDYGTIGDQGVVLQPEKATVPSGVGA